MRALAGSRHALPFWLGWIAISSLGCGARTGLEIAIEPSVRQIFPLSTARVTSQRPTLRWELRGRADGARVEVCSTRDCRRIEESADVAGASFRPSRLTPGVHYWRLQAERGNFVFDARTPVWEFFVPHRDTGTDTAWGSVLDPNGDGRADVTVAPLLSPGADGAASPGCLALYSGTANGLEREQVLAGPGGAGSEFGGRAASAGDVNGDGYGDLVVGAQCDSGAASGSVVSCTGPGTAYVYYGGAAGLASPPGASLLGTPPEIFFGSLVGPLGDVNGDGYGDFFVVASLLDPATAHDYPGSVIVFLGGPDGPVQSSVLEGPEREEYPEGMGGATVYGAVSAGDLNGDGYDDLLIAAWCSANSAGGCRGGSVHVFLGGREGFASTADLILHDSESDDPRIQFGDDIVGGLDVNGDGFADFLIGVVACTESGCGATGRVDVFLGGPSGPSPLPDLHWLDPLPSVTDPDGYGASLVALGDVNADGFDDALVKVPGCGLFSPVPCDASNLAYVYEGANPASAALSQTIVAPDRSAGKSELFAFLDGQGDIDGDGVDDATAVALAYFAEEPIALYTFRGGPGGLPPLPTTTQPFPIVDAQCR